MLLTMAVSQNLTLNTTWKLFELMNIILGTKVFPGTKYMFQKIFNPGLDLKLHYVCKFCGHLLMKGTHKEILCTICKTKNLKVGYQYNDSFMTFDLKTQLAYLFDAGALKLDQPCEENTLYNDISGGLTYKKTRSELILKHEKDYGKKIYLTGTFNADGAPLSKDGSVSITPLFIMINEASIYFRGKNLLLAALWYGSTKPRMEVFLNPFVQMMSDLCTDGIELIIGNELYTVYLIVNCCCVDTVARAPIQGITGVNGYFCCSWCLIKGVSCVDLKGNSTTKYPKKVVFERGENNDSVRYRYYAPEERTEENFASACDNLVEFGLEKQDGICMVSPCVNLPFFPMVWGFVPDHMHASLLGITRRYCKKWCTDFGKDYYIGGPSTVALVDNFLKLISPPQIVRKMPLSLSLRNVMNAREAENWLLFYSVPILSHILPDKYVKHWKLFVGAVQLLLQDCVSEYDLNKAESMLEQYALTTEDLYGTFEMTYNMHQVTHYASSVRHWGPLWSRTSYPFENAIGSLKRLVKASRGIPHQIERRINLKNCISFIDKFMEVKDEELNEFCDSLNQSRKLLVSRKSKKQQTLLGQKRKFDLLPNVTNEPDNFINLDNLVEYFKVVFKGVVYSKTFEGIKCNQFDNSYVILDDGTFCHILNIFVEDVDSADKVFTIVNKFECIIVEDIPYTKKVMRICDSRTVVELDKVKGPAVFVKPPEGSAENILGWITAVPRKHFVLNL